jgi:hypothetical protein
VTQICTPLAPQFIVANFKSEIQDKMVHLKEILCMISKVGLSDLQRRMADGNAIFDSERAPRGHRMC